MRLVSKVYDYFAIREVYVCSLLKIIAVRGNMKWELKDVHESLFFSVFVSTRMECMNLKFNNN